MQELVVDYLSDLHLAFYVNHQKDVYETEALRDFILKHVISKKQGNVLVIAGDICEVNSVVIRFLEEVSYYYDKVFFVAGNHEHYIFGKDQRALYKDDSIEKIRRIFEALSSNDRVVFLDRNNPQNHGIYEYNGFNIAGDTLWYESHGLLGWYSYIVESNDSRLIRSEDKAQVRINKLHKESMDWYDGLPDNLDLIITHVPPVKRMSAHHPINTCYATNLDNFKAKTWIYGHDHKVADFEKQGTHFVANPWGYESRDFKVKTLTLKKD